MEMEMAIREIKRVLMLLPDPRDGALMPRCAVKRKMVKQMNRSGPLTLQVTYSYHKAKDGKRFPVDITDLAPKGSAYSWEIITRALWYQAEGFPLRIVQDIFRDRFYCGGIPITTLHTWKGVYMPEFLTGSGLFKRKAGGR